MKHRIRDQSGFLLLFLLASIVLIGIVVSIAAEQWSMVSRRAKEAELLYRGGEIYLAIQRYSTKVPGVPQYPEKLEDLLKDPRSSQTIRYIRKITKDPMTGEDWVFVYAGNGRVMGVHSSSRQKPIKQDGFPPAFSSFKDASKYCRWVFTYVPNQPAQPAQPVPTPSSASATEEQGCPDD